MEPLFYHNKWYQLWNVQSITKIVFIATKTKPGVGVKEGGSTILFASCVWWLCCYLATKVFFFFFFYMCLLLDNDKIILSEIIDLLGLFFILFYF